MKQLLVLVTMLLSASMLYAQDIITLKTGETIKGKVSEVGINEVKYYKSSNLQGPVYVAAKTEVSQIVYENGSKDVFASENPNTAVMQQAVPQTVIIEQPYSRRNSWNNGLWLYPIVSTHIDLGYHGGFYYGGHHGSHHGHH